MKRREFLTLSAVGAAGLALPNALRAQKPARKPNIVFLLCDDLGYGDIGCFGQKKNKTPNIDRIASEGMKLTQHYSGSTVCAPSRCVLMTGLHTGHCAKRGNGGPAIPADTVTIAKLLKKAGYATGMFGKWGLGEAGSQGVPSKQGFDEFFGYLNQRNAHNYYPQFVYHNDTKVMLNGKKYSHDLIMSHALKFIRANKDKPFFCYLPVTIPHAAMQAPEKYVAPFRKKYPQFEGKIGRYSHGTVVKNPIACFAGMMAKLDEDTGRVLALLTELGIDENTIVIFSSDNGPHHEGGHDPKFWDSNGPLNGLKRSLTDGGIRVPTMARWPKHIKPDTTSEHISAFWDFLPTACELAGVKAPKGIDGVSYLPTLLGKEQKKHEYLYWEFNEQGGKKAVRLGKYKAVQTNIYKDKNAPIRLFDVQSDIGETKDISAKHPEVIARIRAIMAEQTPSKQFPVKYNPNYKRKKPKKKPATEPAKK